MHVHVSMENHVHSTLAINRHKKEKRHGCPCTCTCTVLTTLYIKYMKHWQLGSSYMYIEQSGTVHVQMYTKMYTCTVYMYLLIRLRHLPCLVLNSAS